MSSSAFEDLESRLTEGGVEAALAGLAEQYRSAKQYHELFDARLMQARHRLGLPIILTTPLDELAEPMRSSVESAYLEACREAGSLLADDGKIREAWLYFRPIGNNTLVAETVRRIEPSAENVNELIEVALHEGVAPAYGLKLVMNHFGTCNAITSFDAEMPRFPLSQQQAAAAELVRHLHAELLANVRADVARREGSSPDDQFLADLVRDRDWLFENNGYHVDASHLSAVVRIARIVEDPQALNLALDLTEYGRRLSAPYQFAGDPPFADVHPSHGRFFAAQLGRDVEQGVAYFREQAERADPESDGTAAAETYVRLLVRLGRFQQAFDAHVRWIPPGIRTTGFAPTLLELARLAGNYRGLMEICKERGDLLSFAAGLVSERLNNSSGA